MKKIGDKCVMSDLKVGQKCKVLRLNETRIYSKLASLYHNQRKDVLLHVSHIYKRKAR